MLRCVAVDNTGKAAGSRSGSEAVLHRIAEMQAEGSRHRPLLIFPEGRVGITHCGKLILLCCRRIAGTTSNGRALLSFHKGAFLAGIPCTPVLVHLPFTHFSATCEFACLQILALCSAGLLVL
jgi:hypothetical protein